MKFYLYTILLIGTLFSTAFAVTTKTIPATKAPPRTTTKTCTPKSFTIVHPFGKTLFGACSKANGRFSYYVDSRDCSNVWNCSSKFDISCPSYFNSLYENYYYSSQKGQEFDFVYHDNDCGYDYQGKTYYSYNTGKTLPDKSTTTTKTLPGKTTTTTTKTLPGKTTTTTTKTLPGKTTTTTTKTLPGKTTTTTTKTLPGKTTTTTTKTLPGKTTTTTTKTLPGKTTTTTTKTLPDKTTTTTTKTLPGKTTTTTTKTLPGKTTTTTTKTLPGKTTTTTTKTLPGKTTTTTTKTLPGKTTTTTTKTLPLGSCVPVTKYVTEVETITKIEKITVTVTGNSSPTPTEDLSHCALKYEQCGGKNFNGPTCCQSGSKCVPLNDYYSQCI